MKRPKSKFAVGQVVAVKSGPLVGRFVKVTAELDAFTIAAGGFHWSISELRPLTDRECGRRKEAMKHPTAQVPGYVWPRCPNCGESVSALDARETKGLLVWKNGGWRHRQCRRRRKP